jgi:ABC-type sugar transport system permease subunit
MMAVYSYVTSFKISEYGLGSAIAVVMVAIMALISAFYIREMVKLGEAE